MCWWKYHDSNLCIDRIRGGIPEENGRHWSVDEVVTHGRSPVVGDLFLKNGSSREGHWIKVKSSNYTLRIQRCSIYMFGESWSNSACLRPSWCIALLRRDRAPWWPAGSSPVLAGIIMKRTAGPVLTMHVQTFMIYDMVQIAKNEGFE